MPGLHLMPIPTQPLCSRGCCPWLASCFMTDNPTSPCGANGMRELSKPTGPVVAAVRPLEHTPFQGPQTTPSPFPLQLED